MTADQQQKVRDLLDLEGGLTEWEINFIQSLYDYKWAVTLSERQDETLDEIVRKRL